MAQRCPHCHLHVEPPFSATSIRPPVGWGVQIFRVHHFECPACRKAWLWLQEGVAPEGNNVNKINYANPAWNAEIKVIFPDTGGQIPAPREVPRDYADDFDEACRVLLVSAKASAALARRCLQAVLKSNEYPQHNLVEQVNAFLTENRPDYIAPRSLREQVDAVRHFGNFSAHPMSNVTTLQILEVEPEEAEWCLEVLRGLFGFYFVEPEKTRQRVGRLNNKLASANKPPMKQ